MKQHEIAAEWGYNPNLIHSSIELIHLLKWLSHRIFQDASSRSVLMEHTRVPVPEIWQDSENDQSEMHPPPRGKTLGKRAPLQEMSSNAASRPICTSVVPVSPRSSPLRYFGDSKRPKVQVSPEMRRIPLVSNVDHVDLEESERDDPQLMTEYSTEIFADLYERQERYVVGSGYLERQPDLTWKIRGIVIDWLVHLHSRARMLPETLFLGVNIFDRFLSRERVGLHDIQLVGISSLYIAAKYEEVMCPTIDWMSSAGNYSDDEVRGMELRVILSIDFDIGYANPLNFLRRVNKADGYDSLIRAVAKYLLELSLFDENLMTYRPSDTAAAAIFLAREILGYGDWTAEHIFYSGGCTAEGLTSITKYMIEFLKAPSVYKHLDQKYSTSKSSYKAALISRKWAHGLSN